jgi:hypothetical protein
MKKLFSTYRLPVVIIGIIALSVVFFTAWRIIADEKPENGGKAAELESVTSEDKGGDCNSPGPGPVEECYTDKGCGPDDKAQDEKCPCSDPENTSYQGNTYNDCLGQ